MAFYQKRRQSYPLVQLVYESIHLILWALRHPLHSFFAVGTIAALYTYAPEELYWRRFWGGWLLGSFTFELLESNLWKFYQRNPRRFRLLKIALIVLTVLIGAFAGFLVYGVFFQLNQDYTADRNNLGTVHPLMLYSIFFYLGTHQITEILAPLHTLYLLFSAVFGAVYAYLSLHKRLFL